jgi:aldehyde dehydrogenase (NAD+)
MLSTEKLLSALGLKAENNGTFAGNQSIKSSGTTLESSSPVDGKLIAKVGSTDRSAYDQTLELAAKAQEEWRKVTAPKRGEIVRQFGELLREKKAELGQLVSYEMGKSYQEGLGEVQEMIDICDFAVGLSRQLHGFTMHSERPLHRMYEQYHPLGIVGIISAFNFPVAVWCWNTALAWVCGDACVWKPSEKTPLCGVACQNLIVEVLEKNNMPTAISCLINGGKEVGEWMSTDGRIPLISATGSIRMGKQVAVKVAERLGKSLLELGGNNAVILTPSTDLKMAVPALVFGAVGTCGQRCTSTRRLIIHDSIYDQVKDALVKAYEQLSIGDPLDESNHMGPLIDQDAVKNYQNALKEIEKSGGTLLNEGGQLEGSGYESGCYVKPVIAEVKNEWEIVQEETFAPILYLIKYSELDEAIALQNGVKQGLSSAMMTSNMKDMERFLSAEGSDCGIANVNIGTSGAEIGGAFGGEKETGGGRESGSDAWKIYMRRQTNTINYGDELPLAQGIKFHI